MFYPAEPSSANHARCFSPRTTRRPRSRPPRL